MAYATPMTPLNEMLNWRRDRIGQRNVRAFVSGWLGTSISQYGAEPDADRDSRLGQLRELHELKYPTNDSRVPGGVIRHGHVTRQGRFIYGAPLPALMAWYGDVGVRTWYGRGGSGTYQSTGQKRWRDVTGVTSVYFMNRTAKDGDAYSWFFETVDANGNVTGKTPIGTFTNPVGGGKKWRKHWFRNLNPALTYRVGVEWTKASNNVFDGGDELTGTEAHGFRFINMHKSGSSARQFAGNGEEGGIGIPFLNLGLMADDEISGLDELVITMGTNEQASTTFYADIVKIITWCRKINPTLRVWLMLEGLPGNCSEAVWLGMLAQHFQVAHDLPNVAVTPSTALYTKGGVPNWTPDDKAFMYGPLHPNKYGYEVYARVDMANLTGSAVPVDGGEEGGGGEEGAGDTAGPLVEVVSPADGQVVPYGQPLDFIFKVTDPSGIGASRGVFSQPSGTPIGIGSPTHLTELGDEYYGHKQVPFADLKALGTGRWTAAFRDATNQNDGLGNRSETLARTFVLAEAPTGTTPTPSPTWSNFTLTAGTEFAAGATTRVIDVTLDHPLGIESAAFYAYGSGQAILIGPLVQVGTSKVWRITADLAKMKSSTRGAVVFAAFKADQDTAAKTGKTDERGFTFANQVRDLTAPQGSTSFPLNGAIITTETVDWRATVTDADSGTAAVRVLTGVDTEVLELRRLSGTPQNGVWGETIPTDGLREIAPTGENLRLEMTDVAGNVRESTAIAVAYPEETDGDVVVPAVYRGTATFVEEPIDTALEERIRDIVEEELADLYPDAGYDVVLVLGQSNAQGAAVDFTPGTAPDIDPRRTFQYGATAKDNPRFGAGSITKATDPLIHRWSQMTTDGADFKLTKGPALPFARRYVSTLGAGRRLLLVPAAYSGTGFTKTNHGTELSTHWRPGDNTGVNLYESAIAQAKAALLAAGANARLVGAIWVQGEADEASTASTYQGYLLSLIDGLRTRLDAPTLPFLVGGMVPEGVAANSGRAAIDGVHRAIPSLRPYTSFSAGPSGKFIDSGLHYNASGQEDLGAALFDGLAAAKANIPNPPGQVVGLTAGSAGSTSVPLSWTATALATGYVVEYKRSVDSAWTVASTPVATGTTVSGLSSQVAYDFRVRAVNGGGNGVYSATVSKTTLAAGFVLSDLSTQPTRAYGVRRLHAGYSGAGVRVSRSSDAAEMDVPFTSGGDLDTAAMMTWAGTATVSVVTYYDLTGNGLHLTQATASARARLALNGTLDTLNGKPTPIGNANTYYTNTFAGPSLYSRGASTTCAVTYGTATANGRLVSETSSSDIDPQYVPIMANATTAALLSQRITDDAAGSVAADVGTVAAFSAALVQITSTDTGSSFVKRKNGGDAGTVAYTRSGTLTLNVFTWGGLFRNGAFGAPTATRPIELVTFPAALSDADRNAVEASQKAYFGIA